MSSLLITSICTILSLVGLQIKKLCNVWHAALLLYTQAQFSQLRPVAMAASMAPRMPMYPPGAPGIGQQLFYGQAPPGMIPPQVTIFPLVGVSILAMLVDLSLLGYFCTSVS